MPLRGCILRKVILEIDVFIIIPTNNSKFDFSQQKTCF